MTKPAPEDTGDECSRRAGSGAGKQRKGITAGRATERSGCDNLKRGIARADNGAGIIARDKSGSVWAGNWATVNGRREARLLVAHSARGNRNTETATDNDASTA